MLPGERVGRRERSPVRRGARGCGYRRARDAVVVVPPARVAGDADGRVHDRDAGRARRRRGGLRAAPRRAGTGSPGERAPRRLRAQQRHLRHGARDPWLALAVRRSARPDAHLLAIPHRRRLALHRRPHARLPREADDRARARRPARRPAPAGEPARLRHPRDQGLRAARAGPDPRHADDRQVARRAGCGRHPVRAGPHARAGAPRSRRARAGPRRPPRGSSARRHLAAGRAGPFLRHARTAHRSRRAGRRRARASRASASSTWRASSPARSAPCCSPTSAPRC